MARPAIAPRRMTSCSWRCQPRGRPGAGRGDPRLRPGRLVDRSRSPAGHRTGPAPERRPRPGPAGAAGGRARRGSVGRSRPGRRRPGHARGHPGDGRPHRSGSGPAGPGGRAGRGPGCRREGPDASRVRPLGDRRTAPARRSPTTSGRSPAIRAAGDRVWEARTLNNLSVLHLLLGEPEAAETFVVAAERIFAEEGQPVEAAQARHNRGARRLLPWGPAGVAAPVRRGSGAVRPAGLDDTVELTVDRVKALMTAGLPIEAAEVARDELARARPATDRGGRPAAEPRDGAAGGGRAGGRTTTRGGAGRLPSPAARLVRPTGRADRAAGARGCGAGRPSGGGTARCRSRGCSRPSRPTRPLQAWLLAARLSPSSRVTALRTAAASPHPRLPLVRATGWLAQGARARGRAGDRRGVLAACRRGLDALDRHRATLGSSELRALASGHGADLRGPRPAHGRRRTPAPAAGWSERWRATSLTQPRVRPGERVRGRPARRPARQRPPPAGGPRAGRRRRPARGRAARLEDRCARRCHQAAGAGRGDRHGPEVDRLVGRRRTRVLRRARRGGRTRCTPSW